MAPRLTRPPERLKRRLLTLKENPLMCRVLPVNLLPRAKLLVTLPRRVVRVVYLGARAVLTGVGT